MGGEWFGSNQNYNPKMIHSFPSPSATLPSLSSHLETRRIQLHHHRVVVLRKAVNRPQSVIVRVEVDVVFADAVQVVASLCRHLRHCDPGGFARLKVVAYNSLVSPVVVEEGAVEHHVRVALKEEQREGLSVSGIILKIDARKLVTARLFDGLVIGSISSSSSNVLGGS